MKNTVVIGTVFVDVKGYPKGTYDPQGRNVGSITIAHGGVGRNVAENFANVGMPVSFVGMLEDSPIGNDVERRLIEHGVNIDHTVHAPENGIGMWLAIMNEEGDLAGSISSMPNLSFLQEYLSEHIEEIVSEAEAVILEMDLNESIAEMVVAEAKRQGKRLFAIVGNLSVALSRPDLIQQTDCFICNKIEAAKFFDAQDMTDYSVSQMLDFLPSAAQAAGVTSMVVTMSAQGAVYYSGQVRDSGICQPYAAQVVDTTGAGDAFFSGTVMGLIRGFPLANAADHGARLASATIGSGDATCPVDMAFFK